MPDIFWSLMLVLIAYTDIKYKKIPDKLIIIVGVLELVLIFLKNNLIFKERIYGSILAFIVFAVILFCVPGSFGGGDVKISMIFGFYLGAEKWIKSFVLSVFLAGIYVICYLIIRKENTKKEIAFGPFLCTGAFIIEMLSKWNY